MRSILELRIETHPSDWPLGNTQFRSIAAERDFEISPIRLPGQRVGDPVPEGYWSALHGASGFLIDHPHLLADDKTRQVVEEKLAKGAIAICNVGFGTLHAVPGASFFEDLGIDPTSVGAVAIHAEDPYDHPRLIRLSRREHPMAFRDSHLFREVESILVQGANGIGCSGYAQAAFALPIDHIEVVDLRTDRFVTAFPKPELPIVAVSSRTDWQGQVVALNAGILHDAYSGPLGHEFPGIEAEDNFVFARNLVRMVEMAARAAEDTWEDAYRLIMSIEMDLSRITAITMTSKYGTDWFAKGVPESIRTECERRAAHERNQMPPHVYMDILHHKTVWKANWDAFGRHHASSAGHLSKEQGTRFFGRFNEIRRLAMHGTKQVFTERTAPSAQELRDLRDCRATVTELVRVAQHKSDPAPST